MWNSTATFPSADWISSKRCPCGHWRKSTIFSSPCIWMTVLILLTSTGLSAGPIAKRCLTRSLWRYSRDACHQHAHPQRQHCHAAEGKHYSTRSFPRSLSKAVLLFAERCQAAAAGSGLRIAIENTDGWEPYECAAVERCWRARFSASALTLATTTQPGGRDLPFFRRCQTALFICTPMTDGKRSTTRRWERARSR